MAKSPVRLGALIGAAAALWLASGTAAQADPIFTPIFTALLTAAGVSGTIAGVSVVSIAAGALSGLATAALGIGLSLLLAPKPPKPEVGQIPSQQSLPPRIFAIGRNRLAGFFMLKEEYDRNLYQVLAICGHRIRGFVNFYLNDDVIEFVSGDHGTIQQGTDKRYGDRNYLDFRVGLPTETAYANIVADIPTIWTADHRGDGIASISLVSHAVSKTFFSEVYPYGPPQPSAVADCAYLYDPREPGNDIDDIETWTGEDNPVLGIIWHRCHNPLGPLKPYATAILPNVDHWMAEADLCDEFVPLKSGGTERRYRLNGWTTTEQDDRSSLKAMLDSCDGWHVVRGDGTEMLWVGLLVRDPDVLPECVITDADIISFEIQAGLAEEDGANSFKATYNSPDNGYVSVDTDSVEWDADQVARGHKNPVTIDLPWVQSTGQASRILKRAVVRAKQPRRGRLTLRLSAINALYERWIRVQSNTIPGFANVIIENRKPVLSLLKAGCSIEFIVTGPEIDAYTAATEESAQPPVPQRPATIGPPVPANVDVVAQLSTSSAPGAVYLVVSFDTPQRTTGGGGPATSLDFIVQWRIKDIGAGVPGGWTPQTFLNPSFTTPRMSLTTGNVPDGTVLEVEVASIDNSAQSPWSVTVEVDTTPGAVVPIFTISDDDDALLTDDADAYITDDT